MNWILLIFNVVLQGLAFYTLAMLFQLREDFCLPFLRKTYVFAAMWFVYGFMNFFIQRMILPLIFKGGTGSEMILFFFMFKLLLMPLFIGMIYMLVLLFLELVDERPARWFRRFFWISELIFLLGTVLAMEYCLKTGIFEYIHAIYHWGFQIQNFLIVFIVLFYTNQRTRHLKETRMRKLVQGWILLSGFFVFLNFHNAISVTYIDEAVHTLGNWVIDFFYYMTVADGLWFFLAVIAPAFFLRRRLKQDFAEFRKIRVPVADMGKRAEQLGLSPRESQIVTLVLAGKSNRDIEDELFISQRTVKNHLYNIYRKLNVKNRVGLLRLFLDS